MLQLNFSSLQHDTKVKQQFYAQSLPHVLNFVTNNNTIYYTYIFQKTVNEILP